MRGRKKEQNHKELLDLNPQEFPSLRGDFYWWKDRSKSPLFSLKKMQEIWEEWRGRASYSRSTMEKRERE
jgi:hypothetical protein